MPKIHTPSSRTGSALTIAVAAAAAALTLGAVGYSSLTHRASTLGSHYTAPTNLELAGTLGRLGLDPDTLAASGVSAAQTTGLVNNAQQYLATGMDDLRSADIAMGLAQREHDRLLDLVQSGRASEPERSAFATAKAALASARSQRQSVLTGIFNAATEDLSETQIAAISAIRANRGRDLPIKYLLTNRTDAQWISLRDALANVCICTARGETPHQGCSGLVTQTDVEAATSSAAANLQANLAAVTSAWNVAVGQ